VIRPSRRTIVLLDLALVAWIAIWALVGVQVAREVRELAELSNSIEAAAEGLEQTGAALRTIANVPFIGAPVREIADRVESAAEGARRDAEATRQSVDELSFALALALAVIPTLPLVLLYLPLRVHWRRDAVAVRRALNRDPDDPHLQEFLARRAALTLPYQQLRRVSENAWRDLEEGRYAALADAELVRLGVQRPPGRRRD
jgi:hypothetical protein